MTLRRKGTRVIVLDDARFRWTVAPDDEPGVAVVAELGENPRGRLVSWYEHGVMITPRVVRHAIETAVRAGWDPTAPGEFVQRLEGIWERTAALRQCPCCDYFTLGERGSYEICRVCFWEDDGLDIDDLDRPSGPNHMTLREGRENFIRLGACEQRMLPHVLPVEARSRYAHAPRSNETERPHDQRNIRK